MQLKLDLRQPTRLNPWAVAIALAIALATVVPPLAVALLMSGVILSVGALLSKDLVPDNWRVMAILLPLFVATNLVAVPLSGPILTRGLLASIFGNVAAFLRIR